MKKLTVATALAAASIGASASAQDFWIGQIVQGGWNFCPRGTVEANGQLLAISDNTALFSLLGTQFGGDGRNTFAVPDMRGRSAIGRGQGPGLPNYPIGAQGGSPSVTLNANQMPPHSHTASGTPNGVATPANTPSPAGNVPALTTATNSYAAPGTAVPMGPGSVSVTVQNSGGGQAVDVMNPYVPIIHCIVVFGIFPSRS